MLLNAEQSKLFEDNKNLVYYLISHKYAVEFRDYEDLCQIGFLALHKAVLTYDAGKNYTFSTYAAKCIMNEIGMFYRKENKRRAHVISLEDQMYTTDSDDDSNVNNTIAAKLADDRNYYEEFVAREDFVRRINLILNILLPRDTTIALLKLGEVSQAKAKDILGVSQPQISRRMKAITEKLTEYEKCSGRRVNGEYEFSMVGDYYRVRIYGFSKIIDDLFLEICKIVNDKVKVSRMIRHIEDYVEIVTLKDSSFFEMLAYINILLH